MGQVRATSVQKTGVQRARWAAIGAAIAVSLGAGGLAVTNAVVDTGERAIFVPITPCRLIDTRPANDTVGTRTTPLTPGETLTLQVTGPNGNCTLPTDATAVAANVVAVTPTANGFFTLWPSNIVDRPLTANLNFVASAPPTPNKIDVKLSPTGQLNVFNSAGTTHLVLDVFGYYADHTHDDRYQPIGNYQPAGDYVQHNAVTMTHAVGNWRVGDGLFGTLTIDQTEVVVSPGDFFEPVVQDITGPIQIGNRTYRLSSVTWCLVARTNGAFATESSLLTPNGTVVTDTSNRTTAGCTSLTVPEGTPLQATWLLEVVIDDGTAGSTVTLREVRSVWVPV